MTTTEQIPASYEEAVRTLARWHAGLDRSGLEIYSFPDPDKATVRLIEVSDEFPATGKVHLVTFGPSKEFPFRSSVALLTPAEWSQVLEGNLPLPAGWSLDHRRRVWPVAQANGRA